MDVANALGVIGLAIAVPTAVGAALALMRASYNKARLEESDKDNDRLRKRVDDLEETETRLEARVESLNGQNETLMEAATQRADLEKHHIQVMENHSKMMDALTKILTTEREVLSHVRGDDKPDTRGA